MQDDRPGIDEDRLHVEDDEQHGGQVEADGEPPACAGAGDDARLVGEILGLGRPAAGQPGREKEGDEAENEDRGEKNEQG